MNEQIKSLEKQIEELTDKLFAERAKVQPEPVCDFTFETSNGPIRLVELFGDKTELVVVHNMGKSCPYCTMWADSLEGSKRHIESGCALVMVTPDPAEVQAKLASARGWTYRMVTDASKEFTTAMGYWNETDGWWPGVSTFRKNEDGSITRTGKATYGPGDAFCPPWHFLSLLGIRDGEWSPN
ncbi:MAG: DUF899 family protein [Fimbriimonadaceae bacterium]